MADLWTWERTGDHEWSLYHRVGNGHHRVGEVRCVLPERHPDEWDAWSCGPAGGEPGSLLEREGYESAEAGRAAVEARLIAIGVLPPTATVGVERG